MGKKRRSFEKRLAAYGSMSLAMAAVSMPGAAKADLVSYTAGGATTTDNTPIFFDVVTGAYGAMASLNDFELQTSLKSSAIHAYLRAKGYSFDASMVNGNDFALTGSSVAKISPGVTIGPSLTFGTQYATLASNASSPLGQWNNIPAAADVGLQITRSGQTYYGWANIVVNSDYTITLNSFGYDNTPNTAFTAPSAPPTVPEPASIILLALGAAGMMAYRRKQA